jgi:LPS sulfotransferase NodH
MSNEFAAQEIFNPAQDEYVDHQEHIAQSVIQDDEQDSEWQAFLEETGLTQAEVDAIPVDESYEDEEFRNDWYDDPIDYGE